MSSKKYCTPLTIRLSDKFDLEYVESIDDATGLDITGCEYADLISISAILDAKPYPEIGGISIIKNSSFLDIAREMTNDEHLGILLLYIHTTSVVLIVDDEREIIINVK